MDYTSAVLIAVFGGAAILEGLVIAWSYAAFNRMRESRDAYRASYIAADRAVRELVELHNRRNRER